VTSRSVVWTPGMPKLASAVVAIGVFDGVHVGHQELLSDTVRDAQRRGVAAVAVTFDRDPDQVIAPASAAPQLLTLEDKIESLIGCGIWTVLVVPFTAEMARKSPEEFLDEVLGASIDVVSIHVGRDFRFGARASGDVDALYVWGVEHNVEIVAHTLVTVRSHPVSSTRIRGLVSLNDVVGAEALLGRPVRLRGVVVRGRGEGAQLGFPTANVDPAPFSAMPGSGVYAAVAILDDGARWPAAVSVGVPPTFPQSKEHIEAHLIGFSGDLYGQELALDFIGRIRDQQRFDSLEALSSAIAIDVDGAAALVREHGIGTPELSDETFDDALASDPLVEDPAALAAAQLIADSTDSTAPCSAVGDDWVRAAGPVQLSGIMTTASTGSFAYTAALESAGIPYSWDPYPPSSMPSFRPAYGAFDRSFSVLVPRVSLAEARDALREAGLLEHEDQSEPAAGARAAIGYSADPHRAEMKQLQHSGPLQADTRRKRWALALFFVFIGVDILIVLIAWLLRVLG